MTDEISRDPAGLRPPSWLESPPSQNTIAKREAEKVLDGLRAKVSCFSGSSEGKVAVEKKAAARFADRTRQTRRKITLSTMTGTHLQKMMRQQLHAA